MSNAGTHSEIKGSAIASPHGVLRAIEREVYVRKLFLICMLFSTCNPVHTMHNGAEGDEREIKKSSLSLDIKVESVCTFRGMEASVAAMLGKCGGDARLLVAHFAQEEAARRKDLNFLTQNFDHLYKKLTSDFEAGKSEEARKEAALQQEKLQHLSLLIAKQKKRMEEMARAHTQAVLFQKTMDSNTSTEIIFPRPSQKPSAKEKSA